MRLGQLARKYGVSLHEIISYLQEVDPESNKLGRNSKLSDQLTSQVAKHFENLDLLMDEQEQEQSQTQVQEEPQAQAQTQSPEQEPVRQPGKQTPEVAEPEDPEPHKKEEVAIATDKLMELLESEEPPADLDKITLIKAPKRELDGLKVVGKIDLPEPKRKTAEKDEKAESSRESKHDRRGRKPVRRELSEEELEKRRLKSKKRKEQYEAREEKRRKERENKQRKALNKARYQQKLQQTKSNQQKPKEKIQKQSASSEVLEPPAPPKTWLGKFWRWMNT